MMVCDSAVVERSLPNPRVVSSNPGRGTSSSPSWKWVAKSLETGGGESNWLPYSICRGLVQVSLYQHYPKPLLSTCPTFNKVIIMQLLFSDLFAPIIRISKQSIHIHNSQVYLVFCVCFTFPGCIKRTGVIKPTSE